MNLVNNLEELATRLSSSSVYVQEVWVIRMDGKIICTNSGKSMWKKKNHAKAALTNFIDSLVSYTQRAEWGFKYPGDITQRLIEKGIVSIEQLK